MPSSPASCWHHLCLHSNDTSLGPLGTWRVGSEMLMAAALHDDGLFLEKACFGWVLAPQSPFGGWSDDGHKLWWRLGRAGLEYTLHWPAAHQEEMNGEALTELEGNGSFGNVGVNHARYCWSLDGLAAHCKTDSLARLNGRCLPLKPAWACDKSLVDAGHFAGGGGGMGVRHLHWTLSLDNVPDPSYGKPVKQFPLNTGMELRSLEQTPAVVNISPPCSINYSASPHWQLGHHVPG